jgi:signal recognition particle receptor subunit beta
MKTIKLLILANKIDLPHALTREKVLIILHIHVLVNHNNNNPTTSMNLPLTADI